MLSRLEQLRYLQRSFLADLYLNISLKWLEYYHVIREYSYFPVSEQTGGGIEGKPMSGWQRWRSDQSSRFLLSPSHSQISHQRVTKSPSTSVSIPDGL